jgi:hypothetical protein
LSQDFACDAKRKNKLVSVEQTSANVLKYDFSDELHQDFNSLILIITFLRSLYHIVEQIDEVSQRILIHGINIR